MIRRGMKKKAFCNKQTQTGTACPICGACGHDPCVSQGNGKAMKNTHKGRV